MYEVLYFNVRVSLSLFLDHFNVELHAWKIRRFKNKVIFNLQILYANEAESINPVEKDKEDPQSEVFIVEFTVLHLDKNGFRLSIASNFEQGGFASVPPTGPIRYNTSGIQGHYGSLPIRLKDFVSHGT